MTDVLATLKVALADRYEIEREIGAGGMATVYLARDPRHDRHVALKVLNPELGAVLGVERFLSEIKVTANLQHPNLLPLFDSGEAGGLLFYVMPFVEGETLRHKLEREKQLPIDEAVRISVAVANALDYAHGHGVIHRDLKPENILLQHGQPVVADFGIALAVSRAGGARVTQTGLSLGTPLYMSPEQATGDRVIDGRSDIYSLASMTYEMLTGEPPHTGSTAQAIIARVLTDKPRPIRGTRSAVPEHVEAALEHALEKLPADRFSTAKEFSDALQGRGGVTHATTSHAHAAPVRGWRSRLADPLVLGLAVVAVAAVGALGVARSRDVAPPLKTIRFAMTPPDSAPAFDNYPWPMTISPAGDQVVYAAGTSGDDEMLWLLRTDQVNAVPIPGTRAAHQVLFSPDGEWIAFLQGTKQVKLRVAGGSPVVIGEGNTANGADWTVKDELLLGAGPYPGLAIVNVAGGATRELTRLDARRREQAHLWPIASPDGSQAAMVIWTGTLSSAELALVDISDGKVTPLGVKGVRPLAFLDGYLVYLQADGGIMAVPVSLSRRKATGMPVSVHERVQVLAGNNGNSRVFISRGGAIITSQGSSTGQLTWLERDGKMRVISPRALAYVGPSLSPDGTHIGVAVVDGGRTDVWILDLATSTFSRLTTIGTVSSFHWTQDGRHIVYAASGKGARSAFWRQPASGAAPAELLFEGPDLMPVGSLSPDGKEIAFQQLTDGNNWDIMVAPVGVAGAAPHPLVQTQDDELSPAFSPDGHWISFTSTETGRSEVYIRSYPSADTKIQVSTEGGQLPAWSADGSRLYFQSGTSLMAASVSWAPNLRIVGLAPVFLDTSPKMYFFPNYSITKDGRQAVTVRTTSTAYQFVIAPNWITEFRERVNPKSKR